MVVQPNLFRGGTTRNSSVDWFDPATYIREHPQMDGLVECFSLTLKQMLAKVVTQKGNDWD